MSSKQYIRGGQQRTINSNCGWSRTGHPTQVNKLYAIHKRHCEICKEAPNKLPEFNKEAGLNNGWNGLNEHFQKPKLIHSLYLTEEVAGYVVSDSKTIEKSSEFLLTQDIKDIEKDLLVKTIKKTK